MEGGCVGGWYEELVTIARPVLFSTRDTFYL